MNLDVTKEQIDAQHRKSGLLGIGFHFVITINWLQKIDRLKKLSQEV